MNTTERKTRSAGRARPEMTQLEAIDQIDGALEKLGALLNLLSNDCFDGAPFTAGNENAEMVLALARSLLSRAWEGQQVLQRALATEAGKRFTAWLEQLTALILLLQHSVASTPTVQVFVALTYAMEVTDDTLAAAGAAWDVRHE